MMLIFCSGKNRYERKKKKWKLRGSELKTQALPSTVTAASSYLLTAIRGIHHGFCKHMEQSADLKKKKKRWKGKEKLFSHLLMIWSLALRSSYSDEERCNWWSVHWSTAEKWVLQETEGMLQSFGAVICKMDGTLEMYFWTSWNSEISMVW